MTSMLFCGDLTSLQQASGEDAPGISSPGAMPDIVCAPRVAELS
jgi:hypothetical protein